MINAKKNNPFQNFVGINLEKNTKEGCLLSLKLEENHFNLYGIPHGGVHSTLLDIAMGIAGSYSSSKKEKIEEWRDFDLQKRLTHSLVKGIDKFIIEV